MGLFQHDRSIPAAPLQVHLEGGLTTIARLRPVSFDWKATGKSAGDATVDQFASFGPDIPEKSPPRPSIQ